MVFGEQIATPYQIVRSGSSKKFFKCPQFTGMVDGALLENEVNFTASGRLHTFVL